MSDLLRIGTSGVRAQSALLQTTGNNIANVNTPGYVRERTLFSTEATGGVGEGSTTRVVSEFAQRQMRRDTANLGYFDQYVNEASRVDSLFSKEANSVAAGLDTFFQRMQTAVDQPSSIATRSLVIGDAESILNKFDTLSNLVLDQSSTVNEQLEIFTGEVNNLIQNIASLNKEIAGLGTIHTANPPNALLTERDESLRKLSELLGTHTLESPEGETMVFLASGESLILEDGAFNLFSINGDPDPTRKDINLQLSGNSTLIAPLNTKEIGGKIGGLLTFREEVLEPSQNKLSQIAVAFADSFNEQNQLGMDLDGEIGGNIFTLPTFGGQAYTDNTGNGAVTVGFEAGKSNELSANNFQVTFNTGPDRFTIEALDDAGDVIAGTAITENITAYPTTFNSTNTTGGSLFGLQVTFDNAAGAFGNGDSFKLTPLKDASHSITMNTTRAEDLALASPIRTETDLSNLGSGQISPGTVTNTDPATSDFTAPGGLTTAPVFVEYIGGSRFRVHDSDPRLGATTVLGTTPVLVAGQYNDIMQQAGLGTYGYDFNITGLPKNTDVFTVDYNTGGFNDNRNGLELSSLQTKDTMQKSVVATANADNTLSFHEAYARLISDVGNKTAQAKTSEQASEALLNQSTQWHTSISGVSLDEEAANMIQFQQAYAASARIISTAQTIFDTLLSSVR